MLRRICSEFEALYWLGLVESIAVVILLTRIAKRALAQELDQPNI